MKKLLKELGGVVSRGDSSRGLVVAGKVSGRSSGVLAPGVARVPVDPTVFIEGLNRLTTSVTDYLTVAQQESTKRAAIAAHRDVALAEISAQRENISELMRFTFQERAAVIERHFAALDQALAAGDASLAQSALQGMVQIVQSSPFKSIQEMQSAMQSKDFVMRLE